MADIDSSAPQLLNPLDTLNAEIAEAAARKHETAAGKVAAQAALTEMAILEGGASTEHRDKVGEALGYVRQLAENGELIGEALVDVVSRLTESIGEPQHTKALNTALKFRNELKPDAQILLDVDDPRIVTVGATAEGQPTSVAWLQRLPSHLQGRSSNEPLRLQFEVPVRDIEADTLILAPEKCVAGIDNIRQFLEQEADREAKTTLDNDQRFHTISNLARLFKEVGDTVQAEHYASRSAELAEFIVRKNVRDGKTREFYVVEVEYLHKTNPEALRKIYDEQSKSFAKVHVAWDIESHISFLEQYLTGTQPDYEDLSIHKKNQRLLRQMAAFEDRGYQLLAEEAALQGNATPAQA